MKKLFYLFLTVSLGIMVSSCVDDDDEHVEATVDFQGVLTTLNYSTSTEEESKGQLSEDEPTQDAADSTELFDFTEYLTEAFEELEIIGEKSRLRESTKVEGTSSINYAFFVCSAQANEKIQKKLDNIDLNMVCDNIFKKHAEEMRTMGYNSPEELPFTKLSVVITYYNSMNSSTMSFTKVFL